MKETHKINARKLVQKLGILKSVSLITVLCVSVSGVLTLLIIILRNDYTEIRLLMTLSTVTPLVIAPCASFPLIKLILRIDKLEKEMRELATFDGLTGLLTRRAFFHDTNTFMNIAEREKISFSVVLIDLDKFKIINDKHGHPAGDNVLINFADICKSTMRKGDLIGRIGGDEFAILLPGTSDDTAKDLVTRLRENIRKSNVTYHDISLNYTVSMGLVNVPPGYTESMEKIIKKADESLYQAKKKGRDCFTILNLKDVLDTAKGSIPIR